MLPFFSFGSASLCTYCGDLPNSKDHVIAKSYQSNRTATDMPGTNGPWCWACRDCNVHLSNRWFDTFKERCEWAQERIAKKVKPIIWHDWELEEMGYSLSSYIRRDSAKRKWTAIRADFYQSRDFYLNIESLTWQIKEANQDTPNEFLVGYFATIIADIYQIYHKSLYINQTNMLRLQTH